MIQYFPTILPSSGRCFGPVSGSTGDVRLSFAKLARSVLGAGLGAVRNWTLDGVGSNGHMGAGASDAGVTLGNRDSSNKNRNFSNDTIFTYSFLQKNAPSAVPITLAVATAIVEKRWQRRSPASWRLKL